MHECFMLTIFSMTALDLGPQLPCGHVEVLVLACLVLP